MGGVRVQIQIQWMQRVAAMHTRVDGDKTGDFSEKEMSVI
jgi:hypothetical protein